MWNGQKEKEKTEEVAAPDWMSTSWGQRWWRGREAWQWWGRRSLACSPFSILLKFGKNLHCWIKLIADDQGCLFCKSHILFIYRFPLSNVKAVKKLLASSWIQVFTIHTHGINISEYDYNFEQKAQGSYCFSGGSSTISDFAATIISTIDVIVRSELSKKLQTSCPQLHNMLLDQVHI